MNSEIRRQNIAYYLNRELKGIEYQIEAEERKIRSSENSIKEAKETLLKLHAHANLLQQGIDNFGGLPD